MDMSVNNDAHGSHANTILSASNDERCMAAIDDMDMWDEETPSQVFNADIDAWARHALATNGFGDF